MERGRGCNELDIQLEAANGDLERAMRFTLVGKIHVIKVLNRRGKRGVAEYLV